MGKAESMANIYDGAFHTILNDCQKLVIPLINEVFGETYTGGEEIPFFPDSPIQRFCVFGLTKRHRIR